MYKYLLITVPLVFVGCQTLEYSSRSPSSSSNALPGHVQRQVATLTEEVKQIQYQVEKLTLELEEERRQNMQHIQQLKADYTNLKQVLEAQVASLHQADQQQRKEIMAETSRQLQTLAVRIQTTIDTLAKAIDSRPSIPVSSSFSDNYPKQGVAYTVQSGDTLSEIARKFKANVTDIQNANKIADPKALRAGQTIFIPKNSSQ